MCAGDGLDKIIRALSQAGTSVGCQVGMEAYISISYQGRQASVPYALIVKEDATVALFIGDCAL